MKNKVFKIRGIEFALKNGSLPPPLSELAKLYLVLRALDGDELARELLDKNGTIVEDANGNRVYPPK